MLFFLLSLTLALAQENEDGLENIQEHNEELKLKELMEEKLKKERDTVYYTCIILSRLHIGNYGDELLSIVKNQESAEDQQNVWKKMYSSHAKVCASQLSYEEAVQILSSIKREEFDYSRLPAIYNSIDFNEFKNGKWDRNFSEVENQIWRFIEEFESSLAENNIKKKQDKEKEEFDDLEYLKFAAAQLQQQSKPTYDNSARIQKTNTSDIVFLVIAFAAIIVGINIIIKKLKNSEEEAKQKKIKKQK